MNRTLVWITGIVLLSIPAVFGIFHPGFFVSDDGHWMVIRLSAFYEAFSSGQFPVRFLPRLNQGLGYPVADFLYPLFLYIGTMLHILRFSFLSSIKLILAGSLIASGIGMYLFLKKFFNTVPAAVGAFFYLYLPYHVYDVYIRGSVGEVLALAFVPFIFLTIENKFWIVTSMLVGLLILSHNTLALLFLPVVIVYAIIRKMPSKNIIFFTCFGLLLSAFFWLPALFDKQFTVFDRVAVANSFAYFVNSVSYSLIGWVGLVVFGTLLFFRSFFKSRVNLFFLCLGIISLFLSMSLSSYIWHIRLLSEFVQFPFRFLSLTLVAQSFFAAYITEKLQKNILLIIILIGILLFSSLAYLFPKAYDYYPDEWYGTNVGTTTVQNEYMPKWVTKPPSAYAFQRVMAPGLISNLYQKGTKLSFTAVALNKELVLVSFVYFPGWEVRVDGQQVAIAASIPEGLIQFTLPKGQHEVAAQYKETPLHLFADIISVIGILFLGIISVVKRRYEK